MNGARAMVEPRAQKMDEKDIVKDRDPRRNAQRILVHFSHLGAGQPPNPVS